jgi:hypothetical protein
VAYHQQKVGFRKLFLSLVLRLNKLECSTVTFRDSLFYTGVTKWQVEEVAIGQSGKLTNGTLTKLQVYKVVSWLNGKLTKWLVDKVAS